MQRTFKAICPATKDLQVFEIVSEHGHMVGWCTQCRQTFPMSMLTDGKSDEEQRERPRKRKPRK